MGRVTERAPERSNPAIIIVSHYLGIFPSGTQPYQLWYGLGLIASSFIIATQWH